ncbi:MAG TPA: tetratricopeptide repeat protein [Elusimicrobiota bacterium]|nr:tetratricopeptide repeat protein [Elusimicrobiota bacterium]
MNEQHDALTQKAWDEDLARARAAAGLGRLREAANSFNNLLTRARELFGEADFRALESARSLAESLWEMGDYSRSRAIVRRILSLRPAGAQTLISAGRILRYQEQNAEAAAVLERGASSFPAESDFCYELGRVYDRNGDFERAVRSLMRARDLSPEKKHVWSELAQSLFHSERFGEVMALGTKAAALGASSPELDMQRGLAMVASGRVAEGQELIASASDAGVYESGLSNLRQPLSRRRALIGRRDSPQRSLERSPLRRRRAAERFRGRPANLRFHGSKKMGSGRNRRPDRLGEHDEPRTL